MSKWEDDSEAMSEWARPGRIRIDGHRFSSGAWRMASPDYAGIEVTGKTITIALESFMEALVDRFPERAGTRSDVIIRPVDLNGKPIDKPEFWGA